MDFILIQLIFKLSKCKNGLLLCCLDNKFHTPLDVTKQNKQKILRKRSVIKLNNIKNCKRDVLCL